MSSFGGSVSSFGGSVSSFGGSSSLGGPSRGGSSSFFFSSSSRGGSSPLGGSSGGASSSFFFSSSVSPRARSGVGVRPRSSCLAIGPASGLPRFKGPYGEVLQASSVISRRSGVPTGTPDAHKAPEPNPCCGGNRDRGRQRQNPRAATCRRPGDQRLADRVGGFAHGAMRHLLAGVRRATRLTGLPVRHSASPTRPIRSQSQARTRRGRRSRLVRW